MIVILKKTIKNDLYLIVYGHRSINCGKRIDNLLDVEKIGVDGAILLWSLDTETKFLDLSTSVRRKMGMKGLLDLRRRLEAHHFCQKWIGHRCQHPGNN